MYVPLEVRIKICCALVVTHVLLLHLRENKQCLSKCGSALIGSFSKQERQRRETITIILCDPRGIFVAISFLWSHCLCLFCLNEKINFSFWNVDYIFLTAWKASRTAQLVRIIFQTFTLALLFYRGCSRLSYSKTPSLQLRQCSLELILICSFAHWTCFVAVFCLAEVTLICRLACSLTLVFLRSTSYTTLPSLVTITGTHTVFRKNVLLSYLLHAFLQSVQYNNYSFSEVFCSRCFPFNLA